MNNQEFDTFIKNTLKDLSGPFRPQWDQMETRIKAWEHQENLVSDDTFDELIREKLGAANAASNPANWNKLEQKWIDRQRLGKRIILYQLAGSTILILALMFLFQIGPEHLNPINDIPVETNPSGYNSGTSMDASGSTDTIASTTHIQDNSLKPTLRTELSAMPLMDRSITMANGKDDNENADHSKNSSMFTLATSLSRSDVSAEADNNSGKQPELNSPQDIGSNTNLRSINAVPGIFRLPGQVQSLDEGPVLGIHSPLAMVDPVTTSQKRFSGTKWFLGFSMVPGLTFVKSPFDEVMQEPGYTRTVPFLGASIHASYAINDFEFQSGLNWKSISYNPRLIEEPIRNGEASIYLNRIRFDFIGVPLMVKYYFKNDPCLRIYAMAGIYVNLLYNAKYEIHQKDQGLVSLINDLKINPVYKNTLLGQKEYEPGLVQNNLSSDNVILGSGFGVGLETCLTSGVQLFADSRVETSFDQTGLGPNRDTMFSAMFQTGIRIALH